jgi:hypothetical protein
LINTLDHDGFKIADFVAQMRFSYINIWSGVISQKVHKLNLDEFKTYVKKRKHELEYFKQKIDIYELKDSYEGVFLDNIIAKKINATLNPNKFKSFYYCFDF